MTRRFAIVCGLVVCTSACGGGPSAPAGGAAQTPASVPSATGTPWFEEVAASSGLVFTHRSGHEPPKHRLPEIMGGGAALFDMDDDDDLDALLVQSGSLDGPDSRPRHRLFENDGRGRFRDVTAGRGVELPGYGMGVATGDYDDDGDVDVYLTNYGTNVLLANDGRGTFTDVTRAAGVAASGWSTSAAFTDVDVDGDLDLFVVRYLDWTPGRERQCFSLTGAVDYCAPKNYDAPTTDLLFLNRGNGTFVDASTASGIVAARGNGLGVVVDDVDRDGRPDVFVANDATPNHLWMNQGGGRFVESALTLGVAIDQDGAPKAGMGVHAADVDGDDDNELLVMNLDTESDSYFRNDWPFFTDATNLVGLRVVSRRFTRFGMALVDVDNDGLLDLYEANGRVGLQGQSFGSDPYAEPNLLLRGRPGPVFEEVTPRGGTAAPLIATSRAAAFGDVDNDGGIDILVANRDGAPHLLHNAAPARGHWTRLSVKTAKGRDAIGAVVRVTAGGVTRRRDVRTAYSYLAANDPRVHVGLGAATTVDRVEIAWPGGRVERFGPFPADTAQVVQQGRGAVVAPPPPAARP